MYNVVSVIVCGSTITTSSTNNAHIFNGSVHHAHNHAHGNICIAHISIGIVHFSLNNTHSYKTISINMFMVPETMLMILVTCFVVLIILVKL